MKNRFYVKKRTLLLIAGVVWLLAGFNVARMGILSYLMIDTKWYLFIFSMLVFSAFGAMFLKMSKKDRRLFHMTMCVNGLFFRIYLLISV